MILRPFFLMLSIASFSLSANEVVQGPFEFSPGNFVSVEKGNSTSDVLDLIVKINNKNSRIDSYEHNGSPPSIETIFFKKIEGDQNIIVLVSWALLHRAERINANMYQVYGYTYKNGFVKQNSLITEDPNLAGFDGEVNGDENFFEFKTASLIKVYLDNKFK